MESLVALIKLLVILAVTGAMILLFRYMGMPFVYGILFATVIYQVGHRLKFGHWLDLT